MPTAPKTILNPSLVYLHVKYLQSFPITPRRMTLAGAEGVNQFGNNSRFGSMSRELEVLQFHEEGVHA